MDIDTCKNCDLCQKQLEKLKRLSAKAVEQYDDLLQKFEVNRKQYAALVDRLKERDNQLLKLDQLMVPIYTEYEQVVNKYEIERGCRQEAEKYACKVVNQNKQLKRQSMDLLAVADIDFSKIQMEKIDELDSMDAPTQEYTNQLNLKLKELEDEVSKLRSKLKFTEEELERQRESSDRAHSLLNSTRERLNQSEKSIKMYDKAIEELSKVSEEAYNEYQILQAKYELAAGMKKEMEDKFQNVTTQNEAIKRQSNVLMTGGVTSDMKLMKALGDVEDLTTQIETQKLEYESKIRSLQKEQSDEKITYIKGIEEENKTLQDERETVLKQLEDLETKYKSMEKLYKELETKYEDATRPPPPPPPPPLPPVEKSKNYLRRIRSQRQRDEDVKKKLEAGGVVTDNNFSSALEEMMGRLKDGTLTLNKTFKLKSVRSRVTLPMEPSQDLGKGPMDELNSILNRFKRTKSEGDILATIDAESGDSELARAMKNMKRTRDGTGLSCVDEENRSNDDVFDKKT